MYFGRGFYIDPYYVYMVLPAILLSFWASMRVNGTFKKYDQVKSRRHLTGGQVARMILDANGLSGVPIEHVSGNLTDHYDPKNNVVRLSDATYMSTSVSAIGVAAHEVGHVLQYSNEYMPIRVRMAILPVCQFASTATVPLIILGFILNFTQLVTLGILLFAIATLFQVITLPVEFNASKRAMEILENQQILESDELVGAKKTLQAASLTYVAALLVSLANLLRFILLSNRNNGR